jgi:very-short-patch-repair endonuclease
LKFRRQHPIGPFVVDFYCYTARLIVELDGQSHDGQGEADRRREQFLRDQGHQILRIENDNVLRDPEAVLLVVARAAGVDVQNWMNETVEPTKLTGTSPHPNPHPEGEGTGEATS